MHCFSCVKLNAESLKSAIAVATMAIGLPPARTVLRILLQATTLLVYSTAPGFFRW